LFPGPTADANVRRRLTAQEVPPGCILTAQEVPPGCILTAQEVPPGWPCPPLPPCADGWPGPRRRGRTPPAALAAACGRWTLPVRRRPGRTRCDRYPGPRPPPWSPGHTT